jgi:hypothetical protein
LNAPCSPAGPRAPGFSYPLIWTAVIQNHVDNMWLLGGEIIRDVNEDPRRRKLAAEQLVRKVIYEDGGPLIHNGWEDEQNSFDSTCRKFYRFLAQPRP